MSAPAGGRGGLRPSRRRRALGQNFLTNLAAADRIVDLFDPAPGRPVLEIGPGEGVLTSRLLARGAVVVAVEKDERLAEKLAGRWGPPEGFHLHAGDAAREDLGALLGPHLGGGRAGVLSNLPYSMGTEILVHLLRHASLLDRIVVMLQREVADRICEGPGSRVYGAISVLTQYYTEPRRIMTLEPGSFTPPPMVRSAVIRMPFRERREIPPQAEGAYAAFILAAFHSRRRTLPHNLAPAWGCAAPEAAGRIRACGIDPGRRPESLAREEFVTLFLAGAAGL